jgi:hypothetical protein
MQLSDTDVKYLQTFVEEVLLVIHNDDTGVTFGLEDLALNAGQIIGLTKTYMENLD